MIERLAALLRRGDRHLQVLADAVLPDVLVERARAQPRLVLDVVVDARRGDEAIVGHVASDHQGHAPHQTSFSATVRSSRLERRLRQFRPATPCRAPSRHPAADSPRLISADSRSIAQLIARRRTPPALSARPSATAADPSAPARCAPRSSCRRRESGSAARRPASRIARTSSAGSIPDSTASASFGPMPLIEISRSNRSCSSARGEAVERDDVLAHVRVDAQRTVAPARRDVERGQRHQHVVADAGRRRRRGGSGSSRRACL